MTNKNGELDPSKIGSRQQQAWWRDQYARIQPVGEPGMGHRLFGARMAAGLVHLIDAARYLGLQQVFLRHAEVGYRPTDIDLVERASALFEVGSDFLLSGTAASPREKLADRISSAVERSGLVDPHTALPEERRTDAAKQVQEESFRSRLVRMRTAAGHGDARSAAIAKGWPQSKYFQLETGLVPIDVGSIIAHSLAFGARPEWALTGDGIMQEEDVLDWQEFEQPPDRRPG